jgi:1,4-dihydroxy-2-naphthoyl-CoA hydrolase
MSDFTLPTIDAQTTAEEYAQIIAQYNEVGFPGTLNARMGMEYLELGHDFITARVPVEGNLQPAGLFHGGGHVVLAETLGSTHAALRAGGHNVVGVDLNATHLRSITSGYVYGRAEVLHSGRSLFSHEVRMTDEAGRLLSIVRISNMVLSSQKKY